MKLGGEKKSYIVANAKFVFDRASMKLSEFVACTKCFFAVIE